MPVVIDIDDEDEDILNVLGPVGVGGVTNREMLGLRSESRFGVLVPDTKSMSAKGAEVVIDLTWAAGRVFHHISPEGESRNAGTEVGLPAPGEEVSPLD